MGCSGLPVCVDVLAQRDLRVCCVCVLCVFCGLLCTGAAIAAAVLDHLAHTSRCCGLFATHYHQLAAEHAADPQVAIMHMACAVAEQQQPADAAAGAGAAAAASGESEQQQQEGRGPGAGEENVAEVTFLYKLTPGERVEWRGVCWPVCCVLWWAVITLRSHATLPLASPCNFLARRRR